MGLRIPGFVLIAGSILAGAVSCSSSSDDGSLGAGGGFDGSTSDVSSLGNGDGQASSDGSTALGDGGLVADGSAGGFVHPGILVSSAQLAFVKAKLASNAQPWSSTLVRTTNEKASDGQVFGAIGYIAHPSTTIDCGVDAGICQSMVDDAVSAYTAALTYSYSTAANRDDYAKTAITILNAWSATATASNGAQAQLEEAWASEVFPRAAEILRYTYTPAASTPALDVAAFSKLLSHVFEPQIKNGAPYANGNWELAMADGMIAIGVFNDDKSTFDAGVAMWRARVPAYIYSSADGARPAAPPGGKFTTNTSVDCFWLGAGDPVASCTIPAGFAYIDGMVQETCRDMSHVALGLSSLTNAAETARIQGVDLFGEQKTRIARAYEFSASFDNGYLTTGNWPTSPCGGQPGLYGGPSASGDGTGGVGYKLGWEIANNEFANRLGMSMPNTMNLITTVVRPSAYKASQQIAWESLTSPGTP